jgi:cytochrome c-type biogenesis protein CcmE
MIHVPKVSGAKAKINNIVGLIALLILIAANASAHIYLFSRTVTGVVNDDFGPIVGASVIEVGTLNGVVTDMDGKFTLNNVSNNGQIQVSYIGYLPQTFSVANQTTFNVKLIEDSHI